MMGVVLGLLFTGVGHDIGLGTLTGSFHGGLVITLLLHCGLTQMVKARYVKRYSRWL